LAKKIQVRWDFGRDGDCHFVNAGEKEIKSRNHSVTERVKENGEKIIFQK